MWAGTAMMTLLAGGQGYFGWRTKAARSLTTLRPIAEPSGSMTGRMLIGSSLGPNYLRF
jgi:hypothetical protein